MPESMPRRHLLRGLSALALAPWLDGCQYAPSRPLTIASLVWPGYELMFLARREGWLASSDLELLETSSIPASLAALSDGRADGAALTLDEVLRARAGGIALQVVLVLDISAGADVLLARPGINELRDLAGKRLGVEPTSLGTLMLHKVLAAAKMPASALTLVHLDINEHLDAWKREKLDALITYEPTATLLLAQGAQRLYDSRKLPDTIIDVLAVKPEAITRQPEALAALVAGHFRALRHLRHNPQDAAYRMAGRMGIPAAEVLDAYRGLELPDLELNRKLLDGASGRLRAAAEEISRVMLAAGMLPQAADLSDLARADFLPESS